MRLLFDMGHPAHVHFFRNAIRELQARGHEVKVTARDKGIIVQLLDAFSIPYSVRPDGWRPLNLLVASRFLTKAARAFGADTLVGVHNPYIAAAAVKLRKRCVLFTDTPGSGFVNRLSVRRATVVVTPACLAGLFPNQVTYPGYKEMAYLHPSVFSPDKSVLQRHGLSGRYFVVRFIGWDAHHDSGVRGLSTAQKIALVKALSSRGQVVASIEGGGALSGCIPVKNPVDLHSLLAFSSGFIGEGATMAKEAAVLGVPSVYMSPLAELPPIVEMEKKDALIRVTGVEEAVKALDWKFSRVEMRDVTAEIVKAVET